MNLRILHLSDFHLQRPEKAGKDGGWDIVNQSMLECIRETTAPQDGPFDAVVVTGDVAYSGTPLEYETAKTFFAKLLQVTQTPIDRLLIVPGNHDVDRDKVKEHHRRGFYGFTRQEEVAETLRDQEERFLILQKKFAAFHGFIRELPNLAGGDSPPFAGKMKRHAAGETTYPFVETITPLQAGGANESPRVDILGLNSALFAGYDGDDKRNLALGQIQVHDALNAASPEAALTIALFHHPFECLHEIEFVTRNELVRRTDLILTGHLHRPAAAEIRDLTGGCVLLSAGASFEKRESLNRFHTVEIDLTRRAGVVRYYAYISEYNLWKRDGNAVPGRTDGCFDFRLPGGGRGERRSGETDADSAGAFGMGSGTVVCGNRNRTATHGGVAAGNIRGPVVTGGTVHIHYGEDSEKPSPKDRLSPGDRIALEKYCEYLQDGLRRVSLRGLDIGGGDAAGGGKDLELANVYVDLNTKTMRKPPEEKRTSDREERPEPVSALDAVTENRRAVLLGDPGSGKTTFVKHLAAAAAEKACSAPPGADPAETGGMPLVPVVVTLRHFALSAPAGAEASVRHVWDHIVEWLKTRNLSAVAGPLETLLDEGGAIVFFDGLDENPLPETRRFVRDALERFMERYSRCWFVITCRVHFYKEDPSLQFDLPDYELAPFTEAQIDRFIAAWYRDLVRIGEVLPEDESGLVSDLQRAVRRERISELAPNPLLLTVMALVHARLERLPNARALLYKEAVDVLLWQWEQRKVQKGVDEDITLLKILQNVGLSRADLLRVVARLAFRAMLKGVETADAPDVEAGDLLNALAALHPEESRKWARSVVESIRYRAGLLQEGVRPNTYAFPHRTFQEYLAGFFLTLGEPIPDTFHEDSRPSGANAACAGEDTLLQTVSALAARGAYWRETILLAIGYMVFAEGKNALPLSVIGELCPPRPPSSDADFRSAWLAGEAAVDIGPNRMRQTEFGRGLLERIRERLANLLDQGRLVPRERAEAGGDLARLGDPRPGVGVRTVNGVELPDMTFCYVPPGGFIMGSDDGDDDERPAHPVEVTSYWISRYPVTNAQYDLFVKADGYADARLWTEAKKYGCWKDGLFKGRYGDEFRNVPKKYPPPFDLPNHPVVGVSWFEALAYTRWLSETLAAAGFLPRWWELRLPTEAEWEKAARGGDHAPQDPCIASRESLLENPKPDLKTLPDRAKNTAYPWGPDIDSDRANYDETDLSATSPVGMFPRGESVYGCRDLAGNIWEWVEDDWHDDYRGAPRDGSAWIDDPRGDRRVLRGGSFISYGPALRSAYRPRDFPDPRHRLGGFRVVLAPTAPGAGNSGL